MGTGMILLLLVLGIVLLLAVVVLARTLAFKPPMGSRTEPRKAREVSDEALARLSKAITIPTVSKQRIEEVDFAPFDKFIRFMQEEWPLFHQKTEFQRINDYGLCYRWAGSNPSLQPILLTAHYDVVPVEAGTEHEWTHPGYSGVIADGRVWGRGTLDIKSQLTAHLEAATELMEKGFVPQRDIYFVYGQDEEVGGRNGALKVAEYFEQQGLRFECVLDEGGFAVSGVMKGVEPPLALIGVAEKGFVNYHLSVSGKGGHSSMPPQHTALGNMAKLICRLENNPLPPRLTAPSEQMMKNVAGEMGFVVRMAMANLWLFRPLLMAVLTKNPATNSMVRTTFAATMAKASDAANVLPQKAQAVVNVRLLPGDTVESVQAYILKLAEGLDVGITTTVPAQPSQISPAEGRAYQKILDQIQCFYPGVIATPYLVMGGTDARKYYTVCDHVYRFTPVLITNEEKSTVHSTNESITIENYARMIEFYLRLIESYDP